MSILMHLQPIRRALRQRNFALFTAGNAVSMIGTWMQRVAVGWLAWELTRSTAWLGLIAFADLFPTVLLGPLAGAAADRWNRLAMIRIGEALCFVQAILLLGLSAAGLMTIELLFALSLLFGAASALNQPARMATIPVLVQPGEATAAVAIHSMVFNIARFIGPAIAGVIIVAWGVTVVFAINALTYLAFLLALSMIRLADGAGARQVNGSFFGQVADGIRYGVSHPGIGPMLLLFTLTCIFSRPVVELLPGYADGVFGLGAGGLALFTAFVGMGAFVAGFWLVGVKSEAVTLARAVFRATALLGLALIAFSVTTSVWVALAALLVAGFAMSVLGISMQTLIFISIRAEMRGRVLSLYAILIRGGPAVGAIVIGVISEFAGLRWPLFVASLILLIAWYLLFLRRKAIEAGLSPDSAR